MDTPFPLFAGTEDEEEFDVTEPIADRMATQEDSLEDPLPTEAVIDPVGARKGLHCEIIIGATRQGKERLVESNGCSYVMRQAWASGKKAWRCSVRRKALSCRASMQQDGQTFHRGPQAHCHPVKPGIGTATKKTAAIKKKAAANVLKSASNIVESVIKNHSTEVQ
eukprot:gene8566-biopygen6852